MSASKLDSGCFLNVDLDIRSSQDLQPLVDAFGDEIIDLYVGRVKRTFEAHLELAYSHKQSPTSVILGMCKLVSALRRPERRIWNAAKLRSFDIGIAAPARNRHYWGAASPEAVRAAAKIGAQIAITVYGPMKTAGPSSKRKRRATPAR